MKSDRPQGMPGRRRLFGTDGIRGTANQEPMTSETSLRLGRAIAHVAGGQGGGKAARGALGRKHTHRRRILIGKDTRLSGYMFETALASGICSMGADVLLVGPLADPGRGVSHPQHASGRRGGDLGIPQPLPGQRHQVLFR